MAVADEVLLRRLLLALLRFALCEVLLREKKPSEEAIASLRVLPLVLPAKFLLLLLVPLAALMRWELD